MDHTFSFYFPLSLVLEAHSVVHFFPASANYIPIKGASGGRRETTTELVYTTSIHENRWETTTLRSEAEIREPAIRKSFHEIWTFDHSDDTEGDKFSFTKNIPDTITSWVVTGFSLNPKSGLALTENPSKIQVFQPFFVSTHLPYSVKRGEVISVPVIIFNYMDKALEAEVTMDNEDKEFDFVEASNEVEEVASEDVKRVKRVAIPANSGQSVSFMIRPTEGYWPW